MLETGDRERLVRLFCRLSAKSVYHRFLSPLHEPIEVAAVSGGEIVGWPLSSQPPGVMTAGLAVLVEDAEQGEELMAVTTQQLREIARSRGIAAFAATVLSENRPAIRMGPARVSFRHPGLDGTEMSALNGLRDRALKRASMTPMSNGRPLIGITCGTIGDGDRVKYGQNRSYVRAIEEAGGVPLLIPPQSSIDELFEILDGILFTGGGDVEPTRYDSEDRGSEGIDSERDDLELALARRAAGAGLPMFGICRGQQVINVALDGGLIQDIGEHHQGAPREAATHEVEVTPGSHLAQAIGERVEVNTFHHQVVDPDRIGRGLKVSAFSVDGERFIEGLESEDGKILTVQWHPEDLTDREWARRLFRRLVESASAREPAAPR